MKINFEDLFSEKGDKLPVLAKQFIKKTNFQYRIVEGKEFEQAILEIIKTLDLVKLTTSGRHRLQDWEKGWKEHLYEFQQGNHDMNRLVAKWATRGGYVRFQGKLIKPLSDSFENDFVTVLRYYLFSKYYKNIDVLYEFGVGTGLNLVAASEIFPQIKLIGLDWAQSSIDIVDTLKEELSINISGKKFDLFNPDKNYELSNSSGILTVGTLEQLGENFKPFIHYLLKSKPLVCIHFETVYEFYDQNNSLDYLARRYLRQRNYLRGFLPYLKRLEKENKVKIYEIRRTFGSFYHEGYTYTVWKPL